MSFLAEIKRRKIFQVAMTYAVVAWLVVQVVATIEEPLGLPERFDTIVIWTLIVGFPITLIISWVFNLTTEGFVLDHGEGATPIAGGRTVEYFLAGSLALALAFIVVDKLILKDTKYEPFGEQGILPNSVAVLPFENLSPDPDNAYFAVGVHESILNQLAKIEDMHVIARTSMLRYADGQKSVPEIARELRVQAVMEGSVRYAVDRVLVTAQLIDPRTNAHLWSEEYDRSVDDIFAIQTDVAIRIAQELAAELSPNERQSIEKAPTGSTAAYQLYLRGRLHWDIGEGDDIARSIEYYKQALQRDPEFALAHAGLADAYTMFIGMGNGSTTEFVPLAKKAAARALELDPSLPEAYAARATISYFFDWNFEAGDRDFLQAIALSPNSATAHQYYGKNLPVTFRFDDGIAEIERALELDPYSVSANRDLGETLYYAQRFDEAITQFEQTLELEPGYGAAYWWLVRCYEATGRWDQAVDNQLKQFGSAPQDATRISAMEETYRTQGWDAFWRQQLTLLNRSVAQEYVDPYRFVEAHVRIGDTDKAFQWLQNCLETRSVWISFIHVDPLLDSIRTDPRFTDLLRRAGLERWATTEKTDAPI